MDTIVSLRDGLSAWSCLRSARGAMEGWQTSLTLSTKIHLLGLLDGLVSGAMLSYRCFAVRDMEEWVMVLRESERRTKSAVRHFEIFVIGP